MSKKMGIPTSDGYVYLNISDVIRCQADVNYTHIFTADQKRYTVSRTLKQFEELLCAYNFFRIHNSHIINLDYIKKYVKSGFVTLADNTVLEVSIRKREAFLRAFGRL